jgi:hypothetical protein
MNDKFHIAYDHELRLKFYGTLDECIEYVRTHEWATM